MFQRQFGVAAVVALAAGCGGGGTSSSAPATAPVRLPFTVVAAKSTAQSDETDQPDLAGAYDSLIPVDASYPLPEVPARMHDVTNFRNGRYLRPRIPSARTTADGRIGVGIDASDQLRLMLFTPEALTQHWTAAHDGSADFMAPEVYRVALTSFVPTGSTLRPHQFAVCDTSEAQLGDELYGHADAALHRNPVPVSDTAEAYQFSVFSGALNPYGNVTNQMFAVTLRVVVENAKTPAARIVEIDRVGDPVVATLPYTPNALLEPTITGDGRLMVARVRATIGSGGDVNSATAKPWVDQDGVTHNGFFDVVYAFNDPASGFAPCDPRAWTHLKPISYAYSEDAVRARYGFAKYPMRDPEGTLIAPGEDAGLAYPWIDARGTNVFFTTTHRWPVSDASSYARPDALDVVNAITPSLSSLVDPAPPGTSGQPHLVLPAANMIPVPGTCGSCDNASAFGQAIPDLGFGVFGLWTKGKIVLLDDMTAGTELPVRASDGGQKLARLYQGTGGVVRIGNGFTNVGLQLYDLDTWWPYNDAAIESLTNKFYFSPNFKPADPHDAVWTLNTGHGSAEFSFDAFMDEQAVILSDMNPSMSAAHGPVEWLTTNYGDRYDAPLRLENSATGTTGLVPPYGAAIGDTLHGTRIEPVALGGVNGKGLWLSDLAGVAYTIPSSAASVAQAVSTAYIGIFIDPRFDLASAFDRRLFTLPTGSVNLVGDGTTLQLAVRAGTFDGRVTLPAWFLQQQAWSHLGLETDASNVRVYLDGFLFDTLDKSSAPGALMLDAGDIVLGSPSASVTGFRGWTDEFTVLARALNSAEEACELARGSVVRDISAGPAALYPVSSHAAIASAIGDAPGTTYSCMRNYAGEGYGFLASVDPSLRVGRLLKHIQPLHFGQPRPDESANTFCLMCHRPDQAAESLTPAVLAPLAIPMELDDRRQPLQPNPVVVGDIPMNWLTTGPAQPLQLEKPGEWLFVDEFINP